MWNYYPELEKENKRAKIQAGTIGVQRQVGFKIIDQQEVIDRRRESWLEIEDGHSDKIK